LGLSNTDAFYHWHLRFDGHHDSGWRSVEVNNARKWYALGIVIHDCSELFTADWSIIWQFNLAVKKQFLNKVEQDD